MRCLVVAGMLGLVVAACESPPEDLRTWKASDHDHQSEPAANQSPGAPASAPPGGGHGVDAVITSTWSRQCASCHGKTGAGDGPMGAMVKAKNLRDPAWQGSVTDDAIAAVIRKGRGSMPAFPSLPQSTVDGLVRLVRLMGRRSGGGAPRPSTSAASGRSAAPPAPSASAAPAPSASTPGP